MSDLSGIDRKRKALGRGLDALLPSRESEAGSQREGTGTLPIASIEPNPDQPRKRFDKAEIESLAQSLSSKGVIQPIVVRPMAEGRYRIVVGERRWRAAQLAGLKEIPAVIRKVTELEAFELALIENLNRSDLDAIELAESYRRYTEEFGYSQERIASTVGRSRSAIANTMRLLTLPQEVQRMVIEGALSEGHARAVLAAEGTGTQLRVAREASRSGLSVRETERLARKAARQPAAPGAAKSRSPEVRDLEEKLARSLGARVEVVPGAKRKGAGSLRIHYGSLDELDAILAKLLRR